MRGVVVRFDSAKGYGFIRAPKLGTDVFVHIGDVKGRGALGVGQLVRFEVRDDPKGTRAVAVIPGRKQLPPQITYGLLGLGASGALASIGFNAHWPLVWSWLVAINFITFLLYGLDKLKASRGWFRVPEAVLHAHAFLGGTPAALMARGFFRHKTKKRSFVIAFWSIAVLQAGLVIWYLVQRS